MELLIKHHVLRQASQDCARNIIRHRRSGCRLYCDKDNSHNHVIKVSEGRKREVRVAADWLHGLDDGEKKDMGVEWESGGHVELKGSSGVGIWYAVAVRTSVLTELTDAMFANLRPQGVGAVGRRRYGTIR